MHQLIKIFGAALDPLDIPDRVEIKRAYVDWLEANPAAGDDPLDPYDLLESRWKARTAPGLGVDWIGKFPVESWLCAKPRVSDREKITEKEYGRFLDHNGCHEYCCKLIHYLEENVGSGLPVMIGVDHSLSGGVIRYLKGRYERFNVAVFDSHCDLIDTGLRKSFFYPLLEDGPGVSPPGDVVQCGNFLHHLLHEGVVHPENLWILGAQDILKLERSVDTHGAGSLSRWLEEGLHIVTKQDLLTHGIPSDLAGETYVSVDMDLGSLASVLATRFVDEVGLDVSQFGAVVRQLGERVEKGDLRLIGLDIMEVDIHLVGADLGGIRDYTEELAGNLLEKVLFGNLTN